MTIRRRATKPSSSSSNRTLLSDLLPVTKLAARTKQRRSSSITTCTGQHLCVCRTARFTSALTSRKVLPSVWKFPTTFPHGCRCAPMWSPMARFGLWTRKRCNTVVASIGSSPSRTTFRRSEPTPGCGAHGHDVLHRVNHYDTELLRRCVATVSFHEHEHHCY